MTEAQQQRWATVLDHLVAALPERAARVVVDGTDSGATFLADRLAERLHDAGRHCIRLTAAGCTSDHDGWHTRTPVSVIVADGPGWRHRLPTGGWDLVVWVRTPPEHPTGGTYRGEDADAVVDLHDRTWPVIRDLNPHLVPGDVWYRTESRAFFATRATSWDTKFGDDLPAYTAAVTEAGLRPGWVAVDVGCGTGRAFPALRHAVGPHGAIIGVDLTPQMLTAARDRAHTYAGTLFLADARELPLADASVDAVFAAGLITHLPDATAGLAELARITRPGGRLVLFHPSGRAALAARHGRTLRPDEPLAETVLRATTASTGWELTSYDDAADRFLAIAERLAAARH